MTMSEKKRLTSLSRGFGISVIATGGKEDQSTITSGSSEGAASKSRKGSNVSGSISIDGADTELDGNLSIVSQSTISDVILHNNSTSNTTANSTANSINTTNSCNGSAVTESENENVIGGSANTSSNTTDTQIDVSLSSSTLRRPSYNRLKKIKSNGNFQQNNGNLRSISPTQNQNSSQSIHNQNQNNKSLAMSQRFKSTPSFHSPPPSSVTSPVLHSRSNTSSPYLTQSRRSQHNLHSSHQQSTTRLQRHRSSQQLTKKQKDKLYDDDKDTFDDTDMDVFMYNVPIASSASIRLFQNGNALRSTEVLRNARKESESNLIIPPSPLPGKLSDPATAFSTASTPADIIPPPAPKNSISISPTASYPNLPDESFNQPTESASVATISNSAMASALASSSNKLPQTPPMGASGQGFESPSLMKNPSFNVLSPTAQQLSTFYEFSSHTQAEAELKKRRLQSMPSTADPSLISALDDLTLASAEKLSKLSVTRPSWIPPKDETELHRHEREFKKMIERTSKESLKESKRQVKLKQEKTIGDARLEYLSEKNTLSSSNCSEIRKFITITEVNPTTKYKLFRKMITYKLGDNILLSPPFQRRESLDQSFDEKLEKLDIVALLDNVHQKPTDNELSCLDTILQPIARPIPSNSIDVNLLPKIPALPIQTLLPRLAKIGLTLLRNNYSTPQVRDIVYWLHAHIFTVKFKEEFTKLLTKPSISKQFKAFRDDYSILTVPTSLDLLLDLEDWIISKAIELLIVFWSLGNSRGVRIFIALVICIIRDYHFGWNNLQVVFHSKAHVFVGDGEQSREKFFSRVLNHYSLIK